MKAKISGTFEGNCDFCKKESKVFTIGDEDTKKIVTICKKCSIEKGNTSITEIVDKFGKKSEKEFGNGIKVQKKPVAN